MVALRKEVCRLSMVIGLVACVVLLGGCSDNPLVNLSKDDLAQADLSPGIHRETASLGGGQTLRYAMSVPVLLQREKVPLVISLHGGGLITPYYGEGLLKGLVDPAFKEMRAIIVAPDVPAPSWVDPKSEETVIDFIKHAIEVWPVDPNRVVLTGYSAGGIGAWFLTGKHPDVFSAGIPMAADPVTGDLPGVGQVPLYVIHGSDDEMFSVDKVERAVEDVRAKGGTVELTVLDGVSHGHIQGHREALEAAAAWLEEVVW